MDEAEVLEAVAYAESSWGVEILPTATIVWAEQLQGLPWPAVKRAIDDLAARTEFKPTPQRVRALALELREGFPSFDEVWTELVANASTCDFFDPNPPATMSLPAQALGRSLVWGAFRERDLDTYYVHEARLRYAEITERATRRLRENLPAFEAPARPALSGEVAELVEEIGESTTEPAPMPAVDVDESVRALHRAKEQPRGEEVWTADRIAAVKEAERIKLEAAYGEELAAQERARAEAPSEDAEAAR